MAILKHSSLTYKPKNIWQTFQWTRKSEGEGQSHVVLTKVISCFPPFPTECKSDYSVKWESPRTVLTCLGEVQVFFLSCLYSLYNILSNSQGKSKFLPKWLVLPHWKQILCGFSLMPTILLWNKLVLPGVDVSPCHRMPYISKIF